MTFVLAANVKKICLLCMIIITVLISVSCLLNTGLGSQQQVLSYEISPTAEPAITLNTKAGPDVPPLPKPIAALTSTPTPTTEPEASTSAEPTAAPTTTTKPEALPSVEPTADPTPTPRPRPTIMSDSYASGAKIAYITIDDGPSRNNTPQILDILHEHNIKATFFVLPYTYMDDIYKRIINEGHELANHSYSHKFSDLYDPDDITFFEEDLNLAHDFIVNLGHIPTLYRFPGGTGGRGDDIINPRVDILEALGYRHFDWNVSTGDTDTGPTGQIVETLVNNVILNTRNQRRLIILMHDTADKPTTVLALPIIINELKAMGYEFDSLNNY